ncbi:uncharacterized protein LOC131646901 [Vicia villosa]|uniref:uncharacterized protein LOC131646901 n=1 Tax=Vicia villosa TaxID=3911 RepID=UPI00273BE222|nr:uncharacterized protein LOC131646901 [Vicia villosa]
MNQQANKNNTLNVRSSIEKKVETVDHQSSAGQGQEERKVQVIHEPHSKTSGGVLTGAADAVASTLQSAKDAISKK